MNHSKRECPYAHHWDSDCDELHRMAPKAAPLPTERTIQEHTMREKAQELLDWHPYPWLSAYDKMVEVARAYLATEARLQKAEALATHVGALFDFDDEERIKNYTNERGHIEAAQRRARLYVALYSALKSFRGQPDEEQS